ncbi:hypothetical protein QX776_05065 [Alteromonadaceae bacterium BrNp21-10]|nr:hypothetical protein [Alteromonadaceae bacterium BrNp21-10]
MLKKILLSMTLIIAVSGCKSTLMQPATHSVTTNIDATKSQLIFMRSAFTGQAIQASVFDVTSGVPEFIGIVSNDTKVAYETTPGEHMFMVVGESADFLKTDTLGGKTYYSIVSPRIGFWKARFSMHPVRHQGQDGKFFYESKDFQEIDKDTDLVVTAKAAQNWARENAQSIKAKLAEYLPEWNAKDESKRNQATINKNDHL